MSDDGGSDRIVDGTDGGCQKCGADRRDDKGGQPFCALFISENPERSSGTGIYFHEYHREYSGAWMGGDSGGVKGDGKASGVK